MFLTSKSRIQQTNKDGYWKLVDNELYIDNNGKVMITPRYLWTDGYTFPGLIIPFIGDKNKFDVRPAHAHDLMCRFHERLIVNLSVKQLMEMSLLREYKNLIICEDIPLNYISIEKVTKEHCDNLLKEMMLSCNISKWTSNIVRFGVRFNLNWYLRTGKKSLSEYNIFINDIGLVAGV